MPHCNVQFLDPEDLEKSREEQVFVCEPVLQADRVSVLLSTAQMVEDATTHGRGGVLVEQR